MSFKDSDDRREGYLGELDIEVIKDPVSRWDQDKIFQYADRVIQLKKWMLSAAATGSPDGTEKQPGPVTMGLHIHNPCNENCTDCSGWRSRLGARESIPMNIFCSVIDEAVDMGLQGVQFSGGGEPCMHPKFNSLMRYCTYHHDLAVGLITNGTAIEEIDLHDIPVCCDWVRFSMDAGSRTVRRLSHGADTWDTLIRNIKEIVKNSEGMDPHPVLGGGFLVSDLTIGDAENFIKVCIDLGLTYAQFRPYQYLGAEWFKSEHEPILRELVEQDWPIEVVASGWRKEEEKFYRTYDYCWGSHFRTELNANKSLMPCCHLCADMKNAFGFIEKPGDFTVLWQRKSMHRVDVRKCLPYCIYHRLNTQIQKFMKEVEHGEFLG